MSPMSKPLEFFVKQYIVNKTFSSRVERKSIRPQLVCCTDTKCPLHARSTFNKKEGMLVVKDFVKLHQCVTNMHSKHSIAVKDIWFAEKVSDVIMDNRTLQLDELKDSTRRTFTTKVSY